MTDLASNPVLRGFHPDPSICRFGGRYLLATSTFEWFPGIALYASQDLADWQPVGHALTDRDHLDLAGVPDSLGIWAPSLSVVGEELWLVYPLVRSCRGQVVDVDNYLTTATDPAGPWSTPRYLNSRGIDPSFFHSSDGRHWLLCVQSDPREGHPAFAGIALQEYDAQVGALVGAARVVVRSDELIEGPNLYEREGRFHLMLAEGGTSWNHGIRMAVADDVLGPYTLDPEPLLTTRDVPLDGPVPPAVAKAGHGELVESPDGRTFLVHLASRPVAGPDGPRCILGRETWVQEVEWVGPEPRLRLVGGGHHPRETFRPVQVEPADTAAPPSTPSASPGAAGPGTFGPAGLAAGWISLREPMDRSWLDLETRPGWLRLRGRASLKSYFGQSLVAQRLTAPHAVAEVLLEFHPDAFGQSAGLACWYDTTSHAVLRMTYDDDLGRHLELVHSGPGGVAQHVVAVVGDDVTGVRLRVALSGAELTFAYSEKETVDGPVWSPVPVVLDATEFSDDFGGPLRFTGAVVALCAQDVAGATAWADFSEWSLAQ